MNLCDNRNFEAEIMGLERFAGLIWFDTARSDASTVSGKSFGIIHNTNVFKRQLTLSFD